MKSGRLRGRRGCLLLKPKTFTFKRYVPLPSERHGQKDGRRVENGRDVLSQSGVEKTPAVRHVVLVAETEDENEQFNEYANRIPKVLCTQGKQCLS